MSRRVLGLSAVPVLLLGAWWWSAAGPRHGHLHGFGLPSVEPERGPADVAPARAGGARFVPLATGLDEPVALAFAPGEDDALYVAQKGGKVVRLRGTERQVVADLSGQVSRGTEQGLLGLVFHPRWAENGRAFVNLTNRKGNTEVLELQRRADGTLDTATPKRWLAVDQPYANHNGGHLVFGPDGMLWVGLGDGGAGGDPHGNGQNPKALLGKMLRLDVDGGGEPKVHLLGLRNPWRYSFDRETQDLWIGDVGQDRWEELDVLRARDAVQGGQNFGWNVLEGNHCYRSSSCDAGGFTAAVAEFGHGAGCSIIGGFVYRGRAVPGLVGHALYSDYCTGLLRSVRVEWPEDGGPARAVEALDWKNALDPEGRVTAVTTFGEDEDGELYVASMSGTVFKLVPAPAR